MKDTVIKGTGNSRFLKSVADFKARYPTYDAFVEALAAGTLPIDFNGVNPDGITQLGTPLSVSTLLKHTTAEAYGFSDVAVPDDILYVLSRFNTGLGNDYLWQKINENGTWIEVPGSPSTYYMYASSGQQYYYLNATFWKTLDADENGNIVPKDTFVPSVPPTSSANGNIWKSYRPFYFKWPNSNTVYRFDGIGTINPGNYFYGACTEVTASFSDASTVVGYVNSQNPTAYPPDENDGFSYRLVGQLGEKAHIAIGSYVGTGKVGAANKNSLTFDFVPRFLLIKQHNTGDNISPFRGGASWFEGETELNPGLRTTNHNACLVSVVGTTISWYAIDLYPDDDYGLSHESQYNVSGKTYHYLAIG